MILATWHRHEWTFRPSLAATLATLLLVPLLLALGHWQLQRAAEKSAMLAEWTGHAGLPPLRLGADDLPLRRVADLPGRRLVIDGRWDAGRQILLDNQVLDGQAGYWVFTPLRVGDRDAAVLVNRGWLPVGPSREAAPDVEMAAHAGLVEGIAAPPPAASLFSRQEVDTSLGGGVLRVQQIDLANLSKRLALRLEPWTLRLDPAAADGYRRQWQAPGLTPERHVAYAVQWFLLAALAIGLYIRLNLHRR